MAKHPFLSEAWMEEARAIRSEYEGQAPAVTAAVRANLVITDVPFGEGRLDAHLDTSSGQMDMGLGHVATPDAVVTMDYPTARSFVVDQDQQAVMQAFMAGKIRVQGDMTKLMAMAAAGQAAGPEAQRATGEIVSRMRQITE